VEQTRPDFDMLVKEQELRISTLLGKAAESELQINALEQEDEKLSSKLLSISEERAKVSGDELAAHTESFTKLSSEKAKLDATISSLQSDIAKLRAITDVCPTCGQHLPNVHKPDTKKQEQDLLDARVALTDITNKISCCNAQHQEYIAQINAAFNDEITALNSTLTSTKQELAMKKLAHSNEIITSLDAAKATLNKLLYDRETWDSRIKNLQAEIAVLETDIAKLTGLIAITSTAKEELDQRTSIVKKMDSLIKRDFRGYLLSNIINYIDNCAKDYCNIVFGTKELTLGLNGNALDITYCNKPFDGLSGGEKQRVDLIIQLAIRDLLTTYLGLSANILVLDEVTDFLDKKSCQAVMRLLETELKTVESVFIISHHSDELEIPADSEIKVIKNELGISELF
jgi:DNA repair exonuclease SbcCD ATPase subunit